MADYGISDITAILNVMTGDEIQDNFRRDHILPHLLPVRYGDQENVVFDVQFEGRTGGGAREHGYTMDDDDFDSHTAKRGTLPYAYYVAGASVIDFAKDVAKRNGKGDIMLKQVKDACDKIAKDVGQDSFGGNVTDDPVEIEGLARMIDGGTTVYANINPATYTDWVSTEDTNALASISDTVISQKLLTPIFTETGLRSKLMITTPAVMTVLKAAMKTDFTQQLIVKTNEFGAVDLALAAGFKGIYIEGTPIVEHPDCTTNTIYALNTDFMWYEMMPSEDDLIAQFFSNEEEPVQGAIAKRIATVMTSWSNSKVDWQDVMQLLIDRGPKLFPTLKPLGRGGSKKRYMADLSLQLATDYRAAQGKLTLTV